MKQLGWYISIVCILGIEVLGLRWSIQNIQSVQASVGALRDQRVEMFVALAKEKTSNPTIDTRSISNKQPIADTPMIQEAPEIIEVDRVPTDTQQILPESVQLDVPFTSQAPEGNWDQPWQDACEEAAILMLDAYNKAYPLSPFFARDELQKLVDWQTERGWGGSIDIIDIRTAAAWYMQQPESAFTIIQYPDLDTVKRILADGQPILAVADGTVLPNPHFSGDGPVYHALVITGYDDTMGEFITNDPGTRHGAQFRYQYDALLEALHDWNGGDVVDGMPVVLVLQ